MITLVRKADVSPIDALHRVIVTGCALSLILAGQAFPAFGL